MSGWIKLHRQLQDNPLWTAEPFTRGQAWVDLLMTASYKAGHVRVRGRRIEVPAGGIARAQSTLSKEWKWSRGKVIRFLNELEKDSQIKQITSHDFNVICICNYKQYQEDSTRDGTRDESRDGTRTGHETVHIQEVQQGKEVKKTALPQKNDDELADAKPADCAADLLRHLIDNHGYDERKTRINNGNLTQAKQWIADGVCKQDIDDAVAISRDRLNSKSDDRDPPIGYLATVIAGNKLKRTPIKTPPINTHGGFTPERYQNSKVASKFDQVGVE